MIVVMPMAGRGSRFSKEGYATPKPLIDVLGVPMFVQALRSIEGMSFDKLVVIALEEHERDYGISTLIKKHIPDLPVELVCIPDVTEGQLCTVLAAQEYFRSDSLLVIASDSYIQGDIQRDLEHYPEAEGLISVVDLPGDSWSFAKTDEEGRVIQVAEKERISNHASTGIYYFKHGNRFTEIGNEMMDKDQRVRGEFYIIPVYQRMIEDGSVIRVSKAEEMWDMGTPENLKRFIHEFGNRP